jgi:peptide/nickel transport system permease protein
MGGARLLRYVIRRLLQAIPVVLGVVILNFLLLQLAPGDAATVLAGEAGGAPAEYIQALRERFGLDKPVLVQLGLYMKNILLPSGCAPGRTTSFRSRPSSPTPCRCSGSA